MAFALRARNVRSPRFGSNRWLPKSKTNCTSGREVAKFLQEGFKRNEKGVYFRTGLSLKQVEEAIEFSEKTGERYHPGSLGPGEIIVILYTPDAMVRYEDTTIGKSNPRAYITIRKKSVEKKDMP